MSVLFKALQKAEKENEQRQAVANPGFDPSRLAGSGAIKMGGGRGVNWRTAGLAAAVVLAVAIAGAFFLVGAPSAPPSAPSQVAAVTPPPAAPVPNSAPNPATTVTNVPPGTTETIPVMQPPAQTAPAATAPVQPAAPQVVEAPAAAAPASAPTPAPPATASAEAKSTPETEVADVAAPAPTSAPTPAPKAAPAQRVSPAADAPAPRKQAMPDLPVNSPARALNPPITIQRAEFDLAGVGNQVKVREVSQKARDNVGAGYDALVNGSYDTSLGFYDRALAEEPTSILALLGRAAALQKLGKRDEAQATYNRVLQLDSGNREALSNVTVLIGDRAPSEALTKLMELEREYPGFSPVKAQIGLTFAKMGSYPEALDYLQRAASITPDSIMYQYNMALVLDHLGRNKQAVATYQTVLAALSSGRTAPELSRTDIERRVQYLSVR